MPQLLPSSNSHPADSVFPSSLRKSKQMKQNFHKHLTRHLCHFLRPLLCCYELTRTPANPLTENLLCIVAVSNLSPPILFWTFWLCPHESTETTLVNNTCDLHDPKSMVLCLHLTCPINQHFTQWLTPSSLIHFLQLASRIPTTLSWFSLYFTDYFLTLLCWCLSISPAFKQRRAPALRHWTSSLLSLPSLTSLPLQL